MFCIDQHVQIYTDENRVERHLYMGYGKYMIQVETITMWVADLVRHVLGKMIAAYCKTYYLRIIIDDFFTYLIW